MRASPPCLLWPEAVLIEVGASLFFRDPSVASERVLVPATLLEAAAGGGAAVLSPTDRFEAGQPIAIFYERKREFVQQPVRIESLEPGDEGPIATYVALGDPVSAESRQHYRVTALAEALCARVGRDGECAVQDVSATGFSVTASTEYPLGTSVPVSIEWTPECCAGDAVVQSLCRRRMGYRYGLLSIAGAELRDQLNRLSLHIQREQLRRLSGG